MNVPFFDIKAQFSQIKDEAIERVAEIIDSCSFIGGTKVTSFEQEIGKFLGVEHAIGCGNGTDALVLALRACGVGPGDEVITTPFSFFATAEAIAAVGAKPAFVDIKLDDYMIDPDKIEAAITERTKAILPVQIFGGVCDMERIVEIAKAHGLRVIEDDAQAIGAAYRGRKAGSLADVGCFSFYPTKNLGGAGDGGMVTTNDPWLAITIRALKEHGGGRNGAAAYRHMTGEAADVGNSEKESGLYDPYKYYNFLIGGNSRLDAIQAAILSIKLKHLPEYNTRRAEIARYYCDNLTTCVELPKYADDTAPCWHQFAIRTNEKYLLAKYLTDEGVGCGTFYPVPLHKQAAFNEKNAVNAGAFLPVVENACAETVCLPIYPELTDDQVEYVVSKVNRYFGGV